MEARTKLDASLSGVIVMPGGSVLRSCGQLGPHARDHRQGGGIAGLEDLEQDRLLALHHDDVLLRRAALVDVGDVAQVHDGVADLLDRQVVERLDLQRRRVGDDHEVDRTDLLVTGRQHDVLQCQGRADILCAQAMREQLGLVEVDRHVGRGAAIGCRDRDAGHRDQRWTDQVGGHVVDLRGRHVVRGDLQVQHRHRRRIEHQYVRRRGARGQLLDHGLRRRRDLRLRRRDVGPWLEVDLDDAAAVVRLALDVLDVAHRRRERPLVVVDDPARHVGRGQAVVGPDGRYHRYLDRREDVGGRLQHRHGTEQQNQDREDDERIGPLERDEDEGVHTLVPTAEGRRSTFIRRRILAGGVFSVSR